MITLPNFLSLLRIPCALAFLSEDLYLRILAIFIAGATDFLDGYLARKYRSTSPLGTILDPLGDKFFVIFALSILFLEHRLKSWEAITMLSRDFALIIFSCYLISSHKWANYRFRAFLSGKVTTALQLTVLLALTLNYPLPESFYLLFVFLGFTSISELYLQEA